MLWEACTRTKLTVRMPQPVLTRWEYVGMAIDWVIKKIDEIKKMAQAVIQVPGYLVAT